MTPAPTTTHSVAGVDVQLPMTVAHAVGGVAAFAGDADAIAAALPDDLAPVRLPGGRGIVLLLSVRYVDNPLGAYDEAVVGLVARPMGMRGGPVVGATDVLRGRFGAWIEHMAVSEPFTRQAGEQIWGYPKTLDELDIVTARRRSTLTWGRDGHEILRFTMAARGALPIPTLPVSTYTRIDGVTMRTDLRTRATGVGIGVTGTAVELGDHPVADQLRTLGLDRRPIAASWLSRMHMRFAPARPLHRSRP